jgi:hypothetical protein
LDDYVLGIVGIALSVLFIVVGYRQTIGAKKERANSANADVEKILVRRIFLESYTPRLGDVSRLLEGKARDFRVRTEDLHTLSQVLNSIFTRVIETDFISREQRTEILERLTPIVEEAERAPIEEREILELTSYRRRFLYTTMGLAAMSIVASLAGTLVVFSRT